MKSFLGCGQTPCCITNAETFCSVRRFLPGFQSAISNRESAIPSICGRITPWTPLPRCHSESFAVILSEANPPRRVALDFSADKQQGEMLRGVYPADDEVGIGPRQAWEVAMRFRKTLTLLILAMGWVFAPPAWAQQKPFTRDQVQGLLRDGRILLE